ncbi:dethiobiotin synthase [bacterium]|nr:dethiobiotin synthase [bacterium]
MTEGIFITATGTDIGKTYISGLLVKNLRKKGIDCGYYKPVLSGAEEVDGKLIPGDCRHVLNTAGIDLDPADCASYIFKPAVSPHLASKDISLVKILKDFELIKSNYDFWVVEGAGGIICPLNLSDDPVIMADLIKIMGFDVIIVADSGLGTINSTVLTVEFAKQKNIAIKGIIMNNFDENNFMHIDNKKSIEKLTGVKVIATVKTNAKDIEL